MHNTWHFINSAYTLYCTTSHTKTLLMHSGFYLPLTVMHPGFDTVIIAPSQEPLRTIDGEIQFKSFLCVIFHHQRICEELKKGTMSVEQIGKACIEAICCLLGWSCHSLILSSVLLSLSPSLSKYAQGSKHALIWFRELLPEMERFCS